MARRPLIAGNWKMHKLATEAVALAQELRELDLPQSVDVLVAPPFTALESVSHALYGSRIGLGAQNMHQASWGPYTGEISAPMLYDIGVRYVILGHSERRLGACETDAAIAEKVKTALAFELTPIVALGETLEEHREGRAMEKVVSQARAIFGGLDDAFVARCIVAYEPIWAIGTGLNESPESANEVAGTIRRSVAGLADVRILYGGSMRAENAAALLEQPEIDGGLIGGASLLAGTFRPIVDAAAARATA